MKTRKAKLHSLNDNEFFNMAAESKKEDIISPNQMNDLTLRGKDDSLNDSSRLGLIGESGNSKLDGHLIEGDEISLFKRANTKGKGQR